MKRGDFLGIGDVSPEQVRALLDRAGHLKEHRERSEELRGKSLALLFEKASLRTRASFDVGMHELGGHAVYLGPDEVGLGRRESVPDVARVLSQYVHGVAARTYRHTDVCALAEMADVPVINALSDFEHPCQILADLLTLQGHFGGLAGLRLAYIGDGNNVANSLAFAAGKVGLDLVLASPPAYACDPSLIARARDEARQRGGDVTVVVDPHEAARGARALYTDAWYSMGQEKEADVRRRYFKDYRIDRELVSLASSDVVVMHDLPAHRGEEIADEVLDGPRSVAWEQAQNRLHAQKAVLLWLMA
jgi:ornithine carbamoyltransferase